MTYGGKRVYTSDEHILVCLSASPSNIRIINTAGKMAQAFQCRLTALFVKTAAYNHMASADAERLQAHIQLAKSYGASLEQVIGEDIAYQIAEFAKLNHITQIVVGRSNTSDRQLFRAHTLTDKLISYLPDMEILIIPDGTLDASYQSPQHVSSVFKVSDILKTLLSLGAATGISLLLYALGFSDANAITIYVFGVLVTSIITNHMGYSVFASIASVVIFNYFFTEPRYTLLAYDIGYPMTFLIMFLTSVLTGTLAGKLKRLAQQSAQQAYRTKVLLDTNQSLQKAESNVEIWMTIMEQLKKLTERKIQIFLPEDTDLEKLLKEKKDSSMMFLPVKAGTVLYGVVGIDIAETSMDVFESSIVSSILGECALALENRKNLREKEQAALLAQNEKLRANLLRMISHDLRTPLTSISGNASNLMTSESSFDLQTRQQLYTDIYDDAMWLIGLVENLLSVTRMEEQEIQLHSSTQLLNEVISEALLHLDRKKVEHNITTYYQEEFLLVKIDVKLIIQVLINILNNAIKYTPKGSEITISVKKKDSMAEVTISDNGPGIADDQKEKIFELFYTGETLVADSHRSMGLGLSLCRSIIEAHGGEIHLEDAPSGGAQFVFTLPIEEVQLHE